MSVRAETARQPSLSAGEALARIDSLDPLVHAVISQLDARHLPTGEPILVKDCIDVEGFATTHGSSLFGQQPAACDSEVARRLRQAGYAIVGKSSLSEFCFGATGENVHFGNVCNPWDLGRIPGGSSSGSAAAVAAGMVRFALGTDTGGSVRIPAALCGIVGLRPTLGRVSNTGVLPLSLLCDTVGPMAPTVRETARLFADIAGYDPLDAVSIDGDPNPLAAIGQGVKGLRIGLPRAFYFDGLQREVAAAIEEAASVFERLGARIVDVALDDPQALAEHQAFRFVLADVADARRDLMREHRDRIGSEVRRRIELGEQVSGRDYAACMRSLWRFKSELRRRFAEDVDLLLTPTTPITAPLWSDARDMVETTRRVGRFTYDLGASGIPSMSVPCGFDDARLPIGMQLSAAWGEEGLLFRAGHAYQQEVGDPELPDMHRTGTPR